MGLHVNIYKESRQEDSWLGSIDCTMGGESSYAKGFTVVMKKYCNTLNQV